MIGGAFWLGATILWVLAVLFLVFGIVSLLHRLENRQFETDKEKLQPLAVAFLEEMYGNWRYQGLKEVEAAMDRVTNPNRILWKQIVFWPEANSQPASHPGYDGTGEYLDMALGVADASGFVSPVFTEPKSINVVGYVATPTSLMIFPASAAGISRPSFWQSLIEDRVQSPPVKVELYQTAVQSASRKDLVGSAIVSGLDQLSCVELYFTDMVRTEYSPTNNQIGHLMVTARDGRSIIMVHSNPDVAERVRQTIRLAKGNIPASR
ncbi:MAG: hypothetical protein ACREQW_24950 [Candidatus Binatia bacterium]